MEPMADASTVERKLLGQAKAKHIPMTGSIELLPLCNMSCDMCYVHMSREEMERKGRIHTAEEWLQIGHEMQKAGTLFLLLTGGEPLLYKDFKEVYLGLKKMGMILTINTNGTLLNEQWADFFGQHKPRRINITLYGADDKAYEELCHYPGGFEKTLNAVKLLLDRGVDVRLQCTATPQNFNDIQKIKNISNQLGTHMIAESYILPAERERDKPFSMQSRLSPEKAAQVRMFAIRSDIGDEKFPQYIDQSLERVESFIRDQSEGRMGCLAANASFTVNWQGEIRPCVTLSEPSFSVFEHGFVNAWNMMREACSDWHINEKCVTCKLRPLCKVCVSSNISETGKMDGVPEYLCRMTEAFYELLKQEQKNL